jgi:phage terminase large subunit
LWCHHPTIEPKCTNLIREFSSYRWNETKEGRNDKEEPVKENDHAMDALRYMVMELDNKKVFVYA